jgi:hypothetical protein
MTVRQLVAADLGVSKSRVSQYVAAGMPLDNAEAAIRWVKQNFRVLNWGRTIKCPPTSLPNFHGDPNIRFVR